MSISLIQVPTLKGMVIAEAYILANPNLTTVQLNTALGTKESTLRRQLSLLTDLKRIRKARVPHRTGERMQPDTWSVIPGNEPLVFPETLHGKVAIPVLDENWEDAQPCRHTTAVQLGVAPDPMIALLFGKVSVEA